MNAVILAQAFAVRVGSQHLLAIGSRHADLRLAPSCAVVLEHSTEVKTLTGKTITLDVEAG